MEHAIGTKITLEVVEIDSENEENPCNGCVFYRIIDCVRPIGWECEEVSRTDHKNIIYKEIKGVK